MEEWNYIFAFHLNIFIRMTRFFILLCLIICTSLGEEQEVEVNMAQSTLVEPSQNNLFDVFSVC